MAAVQGFLQTFIMAMLVIAIAVTLGVTTAPSGRSASQPQPLAPPVASGATTAVL
jgi:hypothetical protein